MKKGLIILFLLCCFPRFSKACLNEYATLDASGNFHYSMEMLEPFYVGFDAELAISRLRHLKKKIEKNHSFKDLSDYSVNLMRLGRYVEALELLRPIERQNPEEYVVAANLGTAYELCGLNDSALYFIRKGLQLNPASHDSSEWVHVKILEFKLGLLKDPDLLNKRTVLGLNIQAIHTPSMLRQLNLQLKERIPFSPLPNKIIASLLTDLGDLYYYETSVPYAYVMYNLALRYKGVSSDSLLDYRLSLVRSARKKYANKKPDLPEARLPHYGMLEQVNYLNADSYLEIRKNDLSAIPWKEFGLTSEPKQLPPPAPVSIKSSRPDSIPARKQAIPLKTENESPVFPLYPILTGGVGLLLILFLLWRLREKKSS